MDYSYCKKTRLRRLPPATNDDRGGARGVGVGIVLEVHRPAR